MKLVPAKPAVTARGLEHRLDPFLTQPSVAAAAAVAVTAEAAAVAVVVGVVEENQTKDLSICDINCELNTCDWMLEHF